ncbi:hypothetical protein ACKWRH_32140 [Bradyrhizobium sp. Pa8]|uniref:hypothetical protein n=1 Tax=Bradyrhizobium sp. Pa8 TaxID=3386552 RepID=UPI00403F5979
MRRLSLPRRDHNEGNGWRKSESAGSDYAASRTAPDAQVSAQGDTEEILKAEMLALKTDVERETLESKQRSNHLTARISFLKHRLEMFERKINR